jgi:hypothetical protein
MPVNENVFTFYVSMDDMTSMQVGESLGDCFDELLCLQFGEAMLRLGKQVIVEGVSTPVF